MRVEVFIDTDNAAFDEQPGAELGRILRRLADQVCDIPRTAEGMIGLLDINGNRVGGAYFLPDEAPASKKPDMVPLG